VAAAADQPACEFLINCPLNFSCAGESHVISLRKATTVEGMPLDFEKSAIREDWPIEHPPDPETVRVEILGLAGAKSTVEPMPVVMANNGEATVRVQDGGGVLSLRVETDMRRNLRVSVTPLVKLPGSQQPQELNRRTLQRELQQLAQKEQGYTQVIQQMQQALKGKLERQQQNFIRSRLATAEQEFSVLKERMEKIKGLDDGTGVAESERLYTMAARQRKHIQHLAHALLRIKNKVYGICRVTGKLIAKERLLAVPHATLSIEAKQGRRSK
jgi:RNA polymerase-binding transcription factor DksA